MKSVAIVTICVAMVAIYVSSQPVHPPCGPKNDCSHVNCTVQGEVADCHDAECHCHLPLPDAECKTDERCKFPPFNCGEFATCDAGYCHGFDCTHTRK